MTSAWRRGGRCRSSPGSAEQRLLAAATAGTGADREHWLSDAWHMIADGDSLRSLAAGVRTMALSLGDRPQEYTNASAAHSSRRAGTLRLDGASVIAHGQAMVDATRIVNAGERVLQVATSLEALADQTRRTLRR